MITWIREDVPQPSRLVTAPEHFIWMFHVFTHWNANHTFKCLEDEGTGTAAGSGGTSGLFLLLSSPLTRLLYSTHLAAVPGSLLSPSSEEMGYCRHCAPNLNLQEIQQMVPWNIPVGDILKTTHTLGNQALSPDRWSKPRLTTGAFVLILFLVLYWF